MKLALDHHYSPLIAAGLRDRGHDVVAAVERDWHTLEDEELLEICRAERRMLLTNNVADFAVIAKRWEAEGRPHRGLAYTSDASRPRTRRTVGRFIEDLDQLLTKDSADDAFVDRVHWL